MNYELRTNSGLSLIEVLIAVSLVGIVAISASTAQISGRKLLITASMSAEVENEVRVAMEHINTNIRQAKAFTISNPGPGTGTTLALTIDDDGDPNTGTDADVTYTYDSGNSIITYVRMGFQSVPLEIIASDITAASFSEFQMPNTYTAGITYQPYSITVNITGSKTKAGETKTVGLESRAMLKCMPL